MPAIPHDPKADIQLVRNLLLRAGYEDGLPVLKELLQNADDAGGGDLGAAASTFVILLAPKGLPGATHPLLHDRAGLCVLNDGDFRESDAICLPMLGLSSKAAEQASVGKFGIGLKTVFFLAEAFFFFSSREQDWSPKAKACEFVNPWGQEYRGPWEDAWPDATRIEHHRLFRAFGSGILRQVDSSSQGRFLGVWIPLRLTSDAQPDVIHPHHPAPAFDAVFGARWAQRVLEFMPLLRHVRKIRARMLRADGQSAEVLSLSPCITQGSRFMCVGPGALHGSFELCDPHDIPKCLHFSGHETRGVDEFGRRFQSHQSWPRQAVFGGGTDQPERANPHGAVVFTRQSAQDRRGRLLLQHAVFLPLGESECLPLHTAWDYSVFLHGFFFVDSSRRNIERFDDLADDAVLESVESEAEIRKLWNRTLMREVVAPLVLPSLDAFVKQERMELAEIEALVKAMAQSETLKLLTPWMCQGQRFILCLRQGGSAWERQEWDSTHGEPARWVELPAPDFPYSELFSLMPALAELSEETAVSLRDKPSLADNDPATLGDEELVRLLGSVPISAFQNPQQLAYLLKLIPRNANEREADSPLAAAIVSLANHLVGGRLPEDNELVKRWKEFFQRLPIGALIRLPITSSEAHAQVNTALAGRALPVALLWEDWCGVAGKGVISWAGLVPVLESLGKQALNDADGIKQRSTIVVRLLGSCKDWPETWPTELSRLPLFACRAASGQDAAVSFDDLRLADEEVRLFISGDFWAKELAKAAPELKPLLVEQAEVSVLGLGETPCDAQACVRLLESATRLAQDFASRKTLFDRLLNQTQPTNGEAWKALRCLIHGRVGEWDNQASLLSESEQPDAFVKLAKLALAAANQSWRSIPHGIGNQLALNAGQRQSLKLLDSSAASAEGLAKEIGPLKVDCASLTTTECDTILLQFNDMDVLRGLNIHETLDGQRVRIEGHTYVDDGTFNELPEAFNQLVTRIRSRTGYGRFTNGECSNRLVNKLSWEAVIEIAIGQPAPAYWWETILTAIGNLGTLRTELRDRVRDVAWLPLAAGGAVKPADLLHLAGLEPELDRLPPEVLNGKSPVLRLRESVREHERFNTFTRAVLPSANEASDTLANLLMPHPPWSTGLTGDWSADQVAEWVAAFGDAPEHALRVARLVKALQGQDELRDLLPGFLRSISGQLAEACYAGMLKHLATKHQQADHEQRRKLESVIVRCLGAIDAIPAGFARRVLESSDVTLLNAAGAWKPPGELAPPTAGLSEQCVLAGAFSEAMPQLMSACRQLGAGLEAAPAAHDPGRWQAMANELRSLFEPWRQFLPAPDPIGAFLSLLTAPAPVAQLASEFFHAHNQETVSQWFEQNHPSLLERLRISLEHPIPMIQLLREQTVRMNSIIGRQFNAHRQTVPDRLILGGDPCEEVGPVNMVNGALQPGRRRRVLRFLPLDPNAAGLSVPNAVKCLQEAAEQVILRCTEQRVDLSALFQVLIDTAQVEIQVAQSLVIESALGLLRQIGGHAHTGIRQALELWDKAREAEAEADALRIASRRSYAEGQRQRAKQAIRDLLRSDSSAQAAVLEEVRRKLKQYQYDATSVAFELWQNADDAVCELEKLGGPSTGVDTNQFTLSVTRNQLKALHFGRLINQYRVPGGPSREGLGFKRDLEKMVVQSISDKSEVSAHAGSALTGKFGLGFKSVFLVSDEPEAFSGSLDFAIRGGIYPVRLAEQRREVLVAELRGLAPEHWRHGTMIRLPFRGDGGPNSDEVVALFHRLAPLLVIFSRKLKRLRLQHEGHAEREVRWIPDKVDDGIDVGKLPGLNAQVSAALVISGTTGDDRLQFLLGLGPDGFVPLPEDVPAFWVTAPTRATPDFGFAVNGPFEPDVGRIQLAHISPRNAKLADELARALATRLPVFWRLALEVWEAVRSDMGLASSATLTDLGESLWVVVGSRLAGKCTRSDNSPVAELTRRILWNSENTGLRRFYADCDALPTGLWGEHRKLTRLPNIQYVAAGALDRESVLQFVSHWPVFQQRVRPGRMVSNGRVASVLNHWSALSPDPEALHLATVVERELAHGQDLRADGETAGRLAHLLTPKFLRALKEGKLEEREEHEYKALTELLPRVLLQATDASWHKSSELVVAEGDGVDKDEQMRAAFAPPEARLNPAYTGPALEFFLACRPELKADAGTLAAWALHAASDHTRVATLRYLLDGRLAEPLGEALRARKDDGNWLWQLQTELRAWFEDAVPDAQKRQEILAHRLRLFDEQIRQWSQGQQPPPVLHQEPDEEREPWTVRQLWLWWERQGKPMGDYVLEGESNWPLFHGGPIWDEAARKAELKRLMLNPTSSDGKSLWYRLFGYACLVSAGRTVTELRRFWLGRLEPTGFWTRSSTGDFSEETREIFEQAVTAEFNNLDAGGEQAYFWRRVFYDMRKVHSMVQNDFPAVLLDLVHQGHGEHLLQFLRTGHLPGPEQPRWIGTFGQSADTPLRFIVRELFRLEVITDEAVRPFAFYVCRPVLRALVKTRWISEPDCGFSGSQWLTKLQEDPVNGPKLLPYFDIPLLHMGITHRGDKMPTPPSEQ